MSSRDIFVPSSLPDANSVRMRLANVHRFSPLDPNANSDPLGPNRYQSPQASFKVPATAWLPVISTPYLRKTRPSFRATHLLTPGPRCVLETLGSPGVVMQGIVPIKEDGQGRYFRAQCVWHGDPASWFDQTTPRAGRPQFGSPSEVYGGGADKAAP
ncbi:hypothetical protein VUR80DRAFT_1853 [Thermomyces stellatus]